MDSGPVAIAVAILALCGSVLASWVSLRAQRNVADTDREFESLRRDLDEQERLEVLVDRYQEPLVRAAYDLQSRIWNIEEGDFLRAYGLNADDDRRSYAIDSTLWLFGQYFGWVEILRREAQFLPLPSQDQRQEVQRTLAEIAGICASDRDFGDLAFRVFRADQRALGELMITTGQDSEGRQRTDCLGYAEFSTRWHDQTSRLHVWFTPLATYIEAATQGSARSGRLVTLQSALVTLVDLIDPNGVRFRGGRARLQA